jgi:Flp pilus assembly protein TadD
LAEVTRDAAHARVLLDLKRYDEAISLLVVLVAAEPADGRAWCLLASAHLGAGHDQEAAAAADRAINLEPYDEWPYRLASLAQQRLGNVSAALTAAREACRLAAHEWRAHMCLAQAQLATGVDFLTAERAAAEALRLAPLEPDAHYTAGQVAYAQENWKAAKAYQERALALNPNHAGALNELGRIRFRRGDQPGAARHFIQAARTAPGSSVYGRNVEAAIRLVLSRMLTILWIVTIGVLVVTGGNTPPPWWPLVTGYVAAVALVAGYGAVQFWRMPRAVRPLLRTRRVWVMAAAVYGFLLAAAVAAAAVPEHALTGTMVAVTWLVFAAGFIPGSPVRIRLRGMKRRT